MLQHAIGLHREFGADDARDAGGVAGLCKAHGATEFIVIGEGEGRLAGDECTGDECLGGGGTIEQRERTVAVQFDVIGGVHSAPPALVEWR